jgi:predicted metal-dependent hydrolase
MKQYCYFRHSHEFDVIERNIYSHLELMTGELTQSLCCYLEKLHHFDVNAEELMCKKRESVKEETLSVCVSVSL